MRWCSYSHLVGIQAEMSILSASPVAMAAACHSSTDVHEVKVGSRSAAVFAISEMLAAASMSVRQEGGGEAGSTDVAGAAVVATGAVVSMLLLHAATASRNTSATAYILTT